MVTSFEGEQRKRSKVKHEKKKDKGRQIKVKTERHLNSRKGSGEFRLTGQKANGK